MSTRSNTSYCALWEVPPKHPVADRLSDGLLMAIRYGI